MGIAAGAFEVFQGLSSGGTFSQTLGGVGTILGTIFGGPLGGAVGGMLGSIVGSFFGPDVNAYTQPDNFEGQTGYGQIMANLLGHAGAGGKTYKENPSLGTGGMISTIEKFLASPNAAASLGTTLYTNLMKMFGASATGSGQYTWPFKNIGYGLVKGASGTDGHAYSYQQFNYEMQQFVKALQGGVNAVNNLWSNAVDVSGLYGSNGVVSNPASGSGSSGNTQATINLSFGDVHGVANAEEFKTQVGPMINAAFDEWARRQRTYTRNSGFVSGRF
jgi:hypothetical protein